ncbi:MAG: glycerophosphodiester phosphodiesterase family protein, partial [Ferruginibacter sp.]
LDLGVEVLELDVVISKDKQVVVSHDTYMSADISLKPSGDSITTEEEKDIILYKMAYAGIKKYDVGSKHNLKFPMQQNFPAYKPLLSDLIDSVELYAKEKRMKPPSYNIEIKSQAKTDDIEHPKPQEFVDLVMNVCEAGNILGRMNIQSFDTRPLQLIHKQFSAIKISYLTANPKTTSENFDELGFQPDAYSPYYKTVNEEAVKFCHGKNIKIIPWTVNTKEEIAALIKLGVDGIITDYPDLF